MLTVNATILLAVTLLMVGVLGGYVAGVFIERRRVNSQFGDIEERFSKRIALMSRQTSQGLQSPLQSDVPPWGDSAVLVLGSELSIKHLHSHSWNRTPKDLDVASFDIVILDFTSLSDHDYSKSVDLESLPKPIDFGRLIFGGRAQLFIIGSPLVSMGAHPSEIGATRFIPAHLDFRAQHVSRFRTVDLDYASYLDHCSSAEWFFLEESRSEFAGMMPEYAKEIHPRANDMDLRFAPICTTAFNKPIGVKLTYSAMRQELRPPGVILPFPPEREEVLRSTPVVWLPSVQNSLEISSSERLLQCLFGYTPESSPPAWISEYSLPEEYKIRSSVERLEDEIDHLQNNKSSAEAELRRAREPLGLLFESGSQLEKLVLNALDELGASLLPNGTRDGDDGRIRDPHGNIWILEVKGLSGRVGRSAIRALHDWVSTAYERDGVVGRGLLIVNTESAIPPSSCGSIYANTQVVESARHWNLCILSAHTLLVAITQYRAGTLNQQRFWQELYDSEGVFEVGE